MRYYTYRVSAKTKRIHWVRKYIEKIKEINPVGMRTIKTAIAIVVCLFVYQAGYSLGIANHNDAILACIAAIISMRDTMEGSRSAGIQRLLGTIIGAGVGIAYSYLFFFLGNVYLQMFIIATGIIGVIVICNKVKLPDAIVIACMVYLFIALQKGEIDPLVHGITRFIDTLIGLGISILINHFIHNPDKRSGDHEEQQCK